MKKYIIAAALVLMSFWNLKAQSIYDAELFTNKELSGTARFVGMGGAMGALGADISTMGVNPAGVGLYRSNDFNIGFGYTNTEVKSDYEGSKFTDDKNRFNMPNLGFVISTQMGYSGLKYLNFGFNYTRAKDFNSNMQMGGLLNSTLNGQIVSIADFMSSQANAMFDHGIDVAGMIDPEPPKSPEPLYSYSDVGWMGALGYDGALIEATNDGYSSSVRTRPNSYFQSHARGGIDQYDFNVSGNVSDRFFFGLTIGAYDINYRRYTYYNEDYGYNQYSYLKTNREVDGSGVDFKFGAIFRPMESSPFRIGLAIHTPVFYNLKQYQNAFFETNLSATGETEPGSNSIISINPNGDLDNYDHETDFDLRTPWKFNFSLGHNIGDFLAIGAEYELQDYSSMKFSYDDGGSMSFYNSSASMLKTVHTMRLGLEYRIVPEFAFRAGYNFQTSAFDKDAFNDIPLNSTQTDVQYANNKSRNTFTMGLGYAGKMFYADLGFKFDWYKSDFRPFDDTELNFTKLTTNRSQILLTLGMRL